MKSEKAEIKKIVLDLGGKEIELSVEQAKKLHLLLDEMYGVKIPYAPPIIVNDYRWWWDYPKPLWTYSGGSTASYCNDTQTLTCCIK